MTSKGKVAVAMSGGVDSSVAAALLKQQGYDVFGMTMRLWTEPVSLAESELADAKSAADSLGIPFHIVDISEAYRREVVQFFIDEYARGVTPNPCLRCNRVFKWGSLLEQALGLGADFLATGHYARIREKDGKRFLLRAADRSKDQSYILHILTQEKLAHALFPVGEYPKAEIRALAHSFGLPAADSPESQDLCFLLNEDYREFLHRNAPEAARPGPIVTREGKRLGEHEGLSFYTIGQRKGLGVSSPAPLYVLAKEAATNTLVVGRADELGAQELTAEQVNWISGETPPGPFRAQVKTRYTAREADATVTPLAGDRVEARFEALQRDITPGQAAVFYEGDVVLGGGLIVSSAHSQSML